MNEQRFVGKFRSPSTYCFIGYTTQGREVAEEEGSGSGLCARSLFTDVRHPETFPSLDPRCA